MSIITISRGSHSYGKEIAEKLAKKLGYECISREILLEASEQFNVAELKLTHAVHDSPSILDRFTHGQEKYIAYIRLALLKHLQKDNAIYHGLAGQFFLQGIDHVLKVRILADLDKRIDIVMQRDKVNAKKAEQIINKDDDERRKWSRHMYGIDTSDSNLYDLVIHIDKLTVNNAVNLIMEALKEPSFQSTEASQKKLDEITLCAQIEVALVGTYKCNKISCKDGNILIYIQGSISDIDEITTHVKNIVKNITDATSLQIVVEPAILDVRF